MFIPLVLAYALGLFLGLGRFVVPAAIVAVFLLSPGASLLIQLVSGAVRLFMKAL